jgi:hypothetical protein
VNARSKQLGISVAVILAAGALGFLLGRATADSGLEREATSCSGSGRFGIAVPESIDTSDQLGFYSECERELSMSRWFRGESPDAVRVYAGEKGDEVVAWWYAACGSPAGIVEVGIGPPTGCEGY